MAVCASDKSFMYYKGGILNPRRCCTRLDHAIAAVGFGSEGGKNFYIVRNSWGINWGEQGYVRISADREGAGVCGLLLDPLGVTDVEVVSDGTAPADGGTTPAGDGTTPA